MTSLFGLSNLYLLRSSTDYFSQETTLNPFTHTWSLGVEEQFYILFPFFIWFSGFGRQTQNGDRNLFLLVSGLSIASLVGFLYLYPTNQSAAYFLMPSRFWEIAAGCLIFIGFQKRASVEKSLEKIPPLLVIALIVGVMYLPISLASASTIAVVALSSTLIACLKRQTAAFKIFTNPKVVYIGLISYSLYLWHWGVLSISRWTIGIHWWSAPLQVTLMLGLAVASYRWVETPLRKGEWFGKRWKTLTIGGGVLFIASTSLAGIAKYASKSIYLGNSNILDGEKNTHISSWSRKYCTGDRRDTKKVNPEIFAKCWFEQSNAKRKTSKIFAYGNSYNAQLMPLYDYLNKYKNYPINAFAIYGCTASSILVTSGEEVPGHCIETFTSYKEWFKEKSSPGDILLIANSWHFFSSEIYKGEISETNKLESRNKGEDYLDMYLQELSSLGDELASEGKHLVVTSGIPYLNADPKYCGQWFSLHNQECHELVNLKYSNEIRRISKVTDSYLSERTKTTYIDIFSPISDKVATSSEFIALYGNKGHLSPAGALYLKELFKVSSIVHSHH